MWIPVIRQGISHKKQKIKSQAAVCVATVIVRVATYIFFVKIHSHALLCHHLSCHRFDPFFCHPVLAWFANLSLQSFSRTLHISFATISHSFGLILSSLTLFLPFFSFLSIPLCLHHIYLLMLHNTMTDNRLSLFYVVDGESTSNAFSVKVMTTDTIDDLKDAIKVKKTPKFDDIATDELLCGASPSP